MVINVWNYVNFTENNLNTSIASEILYNKIVEVHKKLVEKLCPLNILFSTQTLVICVLSIEHIYRQIFPVPRQIPKPPRVANQHLQQQRCIVV